MPRDKRDKFSSATYESTRTEVRSRGHSITHLGEQRSARGLSLHPHVDPRTHDSTREVNNFMVEQADGTFLLPYGLAMPWKNGLDMTGSMGSNADIAFDGLLTVRDLVVAGENAVLRRYHVALALAMIEDVGDRYAHQHSEFEPDDAYIEQMRQFSPTRGGGDAPEEYQFDTWYTAERIKAAIRRYGLKGYYFIVGDQIGRPRLDVEYIEKFYGVKTQAYSDQDLGRLVLNDWHAFFLQVGSNPYVTENWSHILGREQVVILPQTQDLPYVEATITGLTEGVLDIKTAKDFLRESQLDAARTDRIVRAVQHIPLRAQANLPNFDKIPLAGARFASQDDLWPIGQDDFALSATASGDLTHQL